jgi:hypothetical protein
MRFAFACAVFGVAQLTLLATLGTVAGQGCQPRPQQCEHDLPGVGQSRPMVNQPLEFKDNADRVRFYPEQPGIFTLRYRAENLCYFEEREINVEVKCPPPPDITITSTMSSTLTAQQNDQIQFRANVQPKSIPENQFNYSWELWQLESGRTNTDTRLDGDATFPGKQPLDSRISRSSALAGASFTTIPLKTR